MPPAFPSLAEQPHECPRQNPSRRVHPHLANIVFWGVIGRATALEVAECLQFVSELDQSIKLAGLIVFNPRHSPEVLVMFILVDVTVV